MFLTYQRGPTTNQNAPIIGVPGEFYGLMGSLVVISPPLVVSTPPLVVSAPLVNAGSSPPRRPPIFGHPFTAAAATTPRRDLLARDPVESCPVCIPTVWILRIVLIYLFPACANTSYSSDSTVSSPSNGGRSGFEIPEGTAKDTP